MSAVEVGHLCWTVKHHADVNVSDLAINPSWQDSGKAEHRIRRALGSEIFEKEDVLWVDIPKMVSDKGTKHRVLTPHPFLPIHERVVAALAWGFEEDILLGDRDGFHDLPRFKESQIVWEHGPCKCACLHTYTDGAPIRGTTSAHKPDSVYVFYWRSVRKCRQETSKRLFTVLRKGERCNVCGCGGKCTQYAVPCAS